MLRQNHQCHDQESEMDLLDDRMICKKFALDQLQREYDSLQCKVRHAQGIDTSNLRRSLKNNNNDQEQNLQFTIDKQSARITKLENEIKVYKNYTTILEAELWQCNPQDLNVNIDIRGQSRNVKFKKEINMLDLPSDIFQFTSTKKKKDRF